MRLSSFLVIAALTLSTQASWFSGPSKHEPAYASWNINELKAWLTVHNVPIPEHASQIDLRQAVEENWSSASAWTYDQYISAQQSFADLRETGFETWDESRLRQFLLEHGVVSPKGPQEYLVSLAKQKYKAYASAASSYSSIASATASSAIYGSTEDQARKSMSSLASRATGIIAQATQDVSHKFDEMKDYVYSDWDESQMNDWLEKKGLLKSKEQKKKKELLQMMHKAWGRVASPIWEAWSDSYIHDWLVQHHIIRSYDEKKREVLVNQMQKYYYTISDAVYDKWTDADLKKWLADHGIIKSDAQVKRDKMLKLIRDNYISADDTFWEAWSDNHIRHWLIDHGYLRSDAEVKRDELKKMANENWHDIRAKTASYLTWPDARLRTYLRQCGMSESNLPTTRPGLLQETRIRWIRTQTRAEVLLSRIRDLLNSWILKAEDTFSYLSSYLFGRWKKTKNMSGEAYEEFKGKVGEGQEYLQKRTGDASGWVQQKVDDAREVVGEKVKTTGQKVKGEL